MGVPTRGTLLELSVHLSYASMLIHPFEMWFSIDFDTMRGNSWNLLLYLHFSELLGRKKIYPHLEKPDFYFSTWFNRTLL